MVTIIEQGPHWARIRASWACIQRASCMPELAKSTRRNGMKMDGSENVLFTLARAFHKGSGIWLIKGDSMHDGSDISRAVERMRTPWSPLPQADVRAA
jgi:hypothetical protein